MKKLIFTLLMFLGSLAAQSTPANGTTIQSGQPVTICWTQPTTFATGTVYFSYSGWGSNVFFSAIVQPQNPNSAMACYAVRPTQTGTLYLWTSYASCSTNCPPNSQIWNNYYSWPIAPPTAGSGLSSVTSPNQPSIFDSDIPDPATPYDLVVGQRLTARQSSTSPENPFTLVSYGASNAIDGNTDGNLADGSVSMTNLDTAAWWEVDLGQQADISSIVLCNRTDCCGIRLGVYWVFISNTPFLDTDTPATLQGRAGTWSTYQNPGTMPPPGWPNPSYTLPIGGVSGEYIRIQLDTTEQNYLTLAEVQVMGVIDGGGIQPQVMSRNKQFRVGGKVLEVPRGDLANIGKFSYGTSEAAGGYKYSYTLDNTDVAMVRLGAPWILTWA